MKVFNIDLIEDIKNVKDKLFDLRQQAYYGELYSLRMEEKLLSYKMLCFYINTYINDMNKISNKVFIENIQNDILKYAKQIKEDFEFTFSDKVEFQDLEYIRNKITSHLEVELDVYLKIMESKHEWMGTNN